MVHLVALAKGARLRSWPLDARQHGHHAAARARRRARRQSRSPRRRVACTAHIDARGRKSTICSRARVCSGRVHTARMRWIKRASQAAHLTLERSCHGTCVWRGCGSGIGPRVVSVKSTALRRGVFFNTQIACEQVNIDKKHPHKHKLHHQPRRITRCLFSYFESNA